MTQDSLFPALAEHDPGGKVRLPKPAHWLAGANFSGPRREWRHSLSYSWGNGRKLLAALMNPSVADINVLDPTLAKIGRLAERWGYEGFSVINACDYRVTDSRQLRHAETPCSASNHEWWLVEALDADMILVGYGKLHKSLQPYADAMVKTLRASGKPLYVLATNLDGSPAHPLYQREDTVPIEWKEK